jgi:hypothetical protein
VILHSTEQTVRMLRLLVTFSLFSGVLFAKEAISSQLLPDLIEIQRRMSPAATQGGSTSPQLFPDLIMPQLEKKLQDLVEKKRKEESAEEASNPAQEKKEKAVVPPVDDELLTQSKTLKELEAHLLKLEGLKPAQRTTLLSLVQTLDERPDDAFITLKGLKTSGKPSPWLSLQELYLSEALGLEEEARDLGAELKGRWFPNRLRISKVEFCRSVKTFGNYEPMGDVLQTGGYTLIYVELTGITQEVETDGYRRNYQVGFEIFSEGENGSGLSEPAQSFEDYSRSRRGETYVWIKWKAMLTPGPYRMVVKVEDTISGQSLQRDKAFSIR